MTLATFFQVTIEENDTVESLYNRFLFPEGVDGMAEAVALIASGSAPRLIQPEQGATYEPMLNTRDAARIKFDQLGSQQLHDFIRGCDKVPGAWMVLGAAGEEVKCFGSSIWRENHLPEASTTLEFEVEGMHRPAIVHEGGLLLFGLDNKAVNVTKLGLSNGKMIPAGKYGRVRVKSSYLFWELISILNFDRRTIPNLILEN